MTFENTKIIYLESSDFKDNQLIYNKKPVDTGMFFIMIQGDYCGYCSKAKPAFIAAANSIGTLDLKKGVIFATIHSDSKHETEVALGRTFTKISGINIKGIPAFILYNAATKKFTEYPGQRTTQGFLEFLKG